MPVTLSKEDAYELAIEWMKVRRIAKGKQMDIFYSILRPFLKYLERNEIYFYTNG